MFKFLDVFSKKSNKNGGHSETPVSEYFKYELDQSPYIKIESRDLVLKELIRHHGPGRGNRFKYTDELKGLGDIFDLEELPKLTPKSILQRIYYRATFLKRFAEDVKRISQANTTHFQILGVHDQRECEWCKSVDGKIMPVTTDIVSLIRDNCKCKEWCRSSAIAVIPKR